MSRLHQSVLITGASKRLGLACAWLFARNGFDLLLHYNHSSNEANRAAQQIGQDTGVVAKLVQADLADPAGISKIVDYCLLNCTPLVHLINNASIFYPQPISDKEAAIEPFWQVNYQAPRRLALALQEQIAKNHGSIVNLVDIYADAGLAEHTAYVAAKAGIKGLTQDLARSLAPDVRVNGVSPGAILWPDTVDNAAPNKNRILQQTATKALGTPEAIAATVGYLALDAKYTTGSVIRVDGGRRDFI